LVLEARICQWQQEYIQRFGERRGCGAGAGPRPDDSAAYNEYWQRDAPKRMIESFNGTASGTEWLKTGGENVIKFIAIKW
jgi:hypothetical protein